MTESEVTTTVTVADLVPGNPPALVTIKRAVNTQGIARHLTQRILVPNTSLAQRLFTEVRRGDEITLTLTITWAAESYETELTDFDTPFKHKNSAHFAASHYAEASS